MSARPARRRLFFALWPEPGFAAQLAATRPLLDLRPERVEDLHLTVLFLGQVAESQIEALERAVDQIRLPPIQQPLVKLEVWPQSGVLCLLGDAVGSLQQLHKALRQAAEAAALDLPPEALAFRAHVTLGRGFHAEAGFVPPPIQPLILFARRFTLAQSMPGRDGARYETLVSWPLS